MRLFQPPKPALAGVTVDKTRTMEKTRISRRKIKLGTAIFLAAVSLFIFSLASMSGPNQLNYLGFTLACDVGLIILAAI